MKQHRLRSILTVAGAAAAILAGLAASPAPATAATTTATTAATAIPARVFSPYFEAYNGDSPLTLFQQSGAKYLVMAFIQTASTGSCTAFWDGDSSTPIASSTFGSDIAAIQAAGGNVIASFGGFTADHDATDIADSCTNVSQIAAAYESVITTYNLTRIDLDIEDNSLTNSAGITRRNQAVAMVESWAASNGRSVQFSYTMPTTTTGLDSSGLAVLQNAIANGATVGIANIMTFDYFIGTTQEMATDTESAANGLFNQLKSLYPSKSAAQLWAMTGITEMVGIDDFGAAETFTTADASTVLNWAESMGVGELSFWALQRDNGGCPGTAGSDTCSGISQSTWFFSHTFEPFTSGGGTTTNDFSVSLSPASGSVTAGGSTTATVKTAVTSGSAQTVSLSASGAPSGVSVSFNPSSVTANNSSTMTISTSSSVAAGTYPITVTGSAASGSHSTSYSLTVGSGGSGGGGSLANGGFETGSLAPWTCQAGSVVVTTPAHSGTHALQVTPTSSQTGECDQTVTLSPNTSHTLTAWVQGNFAFIGVSGGASASTWTSASGWTKLTVSFTTGSSGTVTVFVHGWYAQGNVFADDFSLS
ncbi:MAG TPA: carbohydrate binding domain-containing protein [Streptosporangiaceae bacterium]|nr:carbohydrate binding domain-containing protein [Streptosporangiaceae bacterium]